jgi:hypothetical protein
VERDDRAVFLYSKDRKRWDVEGKTGRLMGRKAMGCIDKKMKRKNGNDKKDRAQR